MKKIKDITPLEWLRILFLIVTILLLIIVIISVCFISYKDTYNFDLCFLGTKVDENLANSFGTFFGGFIGTLLSFLSVFILIYTTIDQYIGKKKDLLKENFFRMLDYHNQNVSQLSVPDVYDNNNKSEHRRVFVQYKIQIHLLSILIKEILDGFIKPDLNKYNFQKDKRNNNENNNERKIYVANLAYIIFYYGVDKKKDTEWDTFTKEKLSKESCPDELITNIIEKIRENKHCLGRTNQTSLSVYFKNMYNAIKMVDDSSLLSKEEKQGLIDIYKAQLSTPELYVILFHFISRFGTTKPYEKWEKYQETYKIFNDEDLSNEFFDGYTIEDCFEKISLTEKAD